MFNKFIKGATDKAKQAAENAGLQDKVEKLTGDAPLPLSGLFGASKKRGATKEAPLRIRHEDSLPKASVRDEALEAQIIRVARSSALLADLSISLCILPSSSWIPERDETPGNVSMKSRHRRAFILGQNAAGENIVRDALVSQIAPPNSKPEQVDDDAVFANSPLTLLELSETIYKVADAGVAAGIEMKRRRVLTSITIHNRLHTVIKVQSLNSQNDDYEEITIPARTQKVFNYLEDADTFNVRDAKSSKLIKSFDPKTPGFGMSVLEI